MKALPNTVDHRGLDTVLDISSRTRIPVLVLGSPGMGKSTHIKDYALKNNLEFIDIRLSTHDITDLTGLPRFSDNRAQFIPFDIFPLEDTPLPEGKKGFLVLLDELTSCRRDMQVAAYRLLLDREVGQYKLHPECVVVAAGNRITDGAVVNEMSSALKSRLITVHLEFDMHNWLYDYAVNQGLDKDVIAFAAFKGSRLFTSSNLSDLDECDSITVPRTMEFVSRIVSAIKESGEEVSQVHLPLISGTIAHNDAIELIKFMEYRSSIPAYEEAIADPTSVIINSSPKQYYAAVNYYSHVDCKALAALEEPEWERLVSLNILLSTFDQSIQILFWRMLVKDNPGLLVPVINRPELSNVKSIFASIREMSYGFSKAD